MRLAIYLVVLIGQDDFRLDAGVFARDWRPSGAVLVTAESIVHELQIRP